MQELKYKLCDADPNMWMKPEFMPEDNLEYYSYVLYYMGYIHCIHHNQDDFELWHSKKAQFSQ